MATERILQDEIRQRVEAARETLVLRFECALCRTDVLDAVDDLGFLGLQLVIELDRGRDLVVDNVDQRHDSYSKNDLSGFFHFLS